MDGQTRFSTASSNGEEQFATAKIGNQATKLPFHASEMPSMALRDHLRHPSIIQASGNLQLSSSFIQDTRLDPIGILTSEAISSLHYTKKQLSNSTLQ
ncbi:hypothetical protein PGT21_014669 [Puccinia graminis f. sp. tritici]|uniref:Uncharacterized protein n=1 Tax=Puccinia graminis f. sp. tritici TaxID=56615 RepID=A0A5B0NYD5_PUCGR|nr:hypothetical protein PGTUg99_006371 [Puccinia graminis f. sp. tritici]KAA1092808.1 hypothetical protein PGT21_014669 [Puccinia graminis f. sp. tritici]